MSKEKIISLTKYLGRLEDKLASPASAKHVGHTQTYREFLLREIHTVRLKLEQAKLQGVK